MVSEEELIEEEDEIVSEAAEYSPKSEFNKAKIVYEAMQICINNRCKEMKAGYYNTKFGKDGFPIKIWIEDARQIYVGSVTAVRNLLNPEIKGEDQEQFKTKMESYKKEEEKIKEKYIYKERVKENFNGRIIWKETGRNFIPEINSKVTVVNIQNPHSAYEVVGGWDVYINAYWNELVELYDRIFATLNDLVNNMNYFKAGIQW